MFFCRNTLSWDRSPLQCYLSYTGWKTVLIRQRSQLLKAAVFSVLLAANIWKLYFTHVCKREEGISKINTWFKKQFELQADRKFNCEVSSIKWKSARTFAYIKLQHIWNLKPVACIYHYVSFYIQISNAEKQTAKIIWIEKIITETHSVLPNKYVKYLPMVHITWKRY